MRCNGLENLTRLGDSWGNGNSWTAPSLRALAQRLMTIHSPSSRGSSTMGGRCRRMEFGGTNGPLRVMLVGAGVLQKT